MTCIKTEGVRWVKVVNQNKLMIRGVFKKAVQKVIDAAKKHDKSLARMVPDVATGLALNKQGFDFIAYSGDIWVYQAALMAGVDELRRKCKPRRARPA